MIAELERADTNVSPEPVDLAAEVNRLRALLEYVAEAVDVAADADWREATDLLLDLSDRIRAELRA